MTTDSARPDIVKTLAQVFGFLAALVGLVYVVGGGVLAARLSLEHLPSLTVVGQLPREFLIAVGLTQIVLPALGAAALYCIFRVLAAPQAAAPRRLIRQWEERSLRGWSELVVVSAGLAAGLVLAGAAPALRREGWTSELLWLIVIGIAVASLVMLVALNLRARIAGRHAGAWSTARPIGLMAAVVAFASLPAWMLFSGTFRLLDAKACTASGAAVRGVLIGESTNRIYLGEPDPREEPPNFRPGPRRVVSIPLAQLEQVFIGGEASEKSCGPRRAREA